MIEKEWRFYTSEDDAEWVILSNSDKAETEEDIYSVNKSESIMRMYRKPGDYISVSLLSASYEIDIVTGKLGQERDFYIKIECLKDGWSSISTKSYKKEEALNIAEIFVGLRKDVAIKIWNLKKLGENNFGNRIEK
ncbi:hypothetical protein HYE59_12380 [Aggregatibacter actinomycetemcomitans]|uniref:hypothetical protein n=1 Tax=Aggregatibacter actinomycetemcomitans TaxID=714 RepID=UPI00197C885C|nr:hypothetical protein [Aggregatibacter actinomycetemcomitans]MBN6078292.1 hypothetical protein [Aggregatibacter actinomycetemcomitans]